LPRLALLWTLAVVAAAATAAPIGSRADLDAHLREHAADSPLNALSPGARERFLYSLKFDSRAGLIAASGVDVADELTDEQIRAVFELFGPEVARHAPPSLLEDVRGVERNVRSRDQVGAAERSYIDYFKAVTDAGGAEADQERDAMAAAFDQNLAGLYQGRGLARLDDRELRLLRRAAQEVSLATRAPPHVDAFRAVFEERRRRNLLSSTDLETLHSLLVSTYRIADARRLAGDFPQAGLPRLPSFKDDVGEKPGAATVWRFSREGRQLTREIVDLQPAQVLVTVGGLESRQVADDIHADATLGPVFSRHARWLAQPPGVEPLDDARQWNAAREEQPLLLVHSRAEWQLLPRWRVPEFYVVKEGKVVDSVSGWERGSAKWREQLVAMLERHGLLEPR
jgi:hypothetical protein